MSCLHGNHPNNCEICDEAETAYMSGYNDGETKPWVGLTAEERLDIWTNTATPMLIAATEAKLKDKNT